MYNKISSIILNSGKANGLSDVFIAQPDSLKENLAGKVFIIADIGGKKAEGRKILDFLISSLNETYYNDEKILLRDYVFPLTGSYKIPRATYRRFIENSSVSVRDQVSQLLGLNAST
jgi:hypothetical protein